MQFRCTFCEQFSHEIAVGTNPQLVQDELILFGVVRFAACGHLAYCPHLARRCSTVLEHLEQGCLVPDDLCGLIEDDHELESDGT